MERVQSFLQQTILVRRRQSVGHLFVYYCLCEKKALESSDSICPIVLQHSKIFSTSPLPLTIYSTIENIFLSELWLFDNANTLFFNSDFSHTKTHTWFHLLQGGANLHENRLMKHILHILMWDWACNGWSQIGITRYIHLYA